MSRATCMTTEQIAGRLTAWGERFEAVLVDALRTNEDVPSPLAEAVRYATLGGGKRVRPFVLSRVCELCGGSEREAAPAAVAIECVHAFSLIHDDLPAMDDDDFRRGRPSCHKAFSEAVAILAGDALFARAFELLADGFRDPQQSTDAVAELARACGWSGIIGGQTLDILNEPGTPSLEQVTRIHLLKTARLFECAARLGAICARADEAQTRAAVTFGRQLGLAFQIADDLLDQAGAPNGVAPGKGDPADQPTYPAAIGVEASRRAAEEAVAQAVAALDIFGPPADDLRALARFVIEREL
ncbi:MAG: polyprenyl synthetase family protein [Phycisphaerales bacterium]|nr:polyprenyl synthetase family protein [Phycisphaerales bacterium]